MQVDLTRQSVVNFNYEDLRAHCPYADFAGALRDEPEELLQCLGMSLCALRARLLPPSAPAIKVTPRILNVTPITQLRELKSNFVGKFVSVRGNVVRVSAVRPLVLRMAFQCAKCSADVPMWFAEGKYEPPTRCSDSTCRSKVFSPLYNTAVTVDWQKVRIQELEADLADAGRVPRTLECELTEDLVDSCVPGDVVTVAGIVKAIETEVAAGGGTAKARSLFLLYVDAKSVTTHKVSERDSVAPYASAANGPVASGPVKNFSERDLAAINRIRSFRDPFSLVVASMCPNIFGHETVKAGMLFGLFGGTPRHALPEVTTGSSAGAATTGASVRSHVYEGRGSAAHDADDVIVLDDESVIGGAGAGDPAGSPRLLGSQMARAGSGSSASSAATPFEKLSSRLHIRADPHILVVGNPGMGKSQMLQALSGLAPRGVYVCGNTTSATGLTVVRARRRTAAAATSCSRTRQCNYASNGASCDYRSLLCSC